MRWMTCAVLLAATGCGQGWFDDPSGGGANLPTLGAGPYGKPEFDFDTPAEEPYVVVDNSGNLYDPAALPRDDGGVRLWFARSADQVDDAREIWRAELPGVLELPDVPSVLAMPASQDWEEGWVAAPSVIEVAGDRLVMYYEGGVSSRGIGRAESNDGGASWTKSAANPVIEDATDPAAALADGQVLVYFTRPGADGIWRGTSADGLAFELDTEPVLQPRPNDPEAFDRGGVSEPYVLVEETVAGRLHYGMFYVGSDGDEDVAIGYAGSFDGVLWQRFNGNEPILTAGSPTEHGPAAVVQEARGFLFYDQRGAGRQRIGVALHP